MKTRYPYDDGCLAVIGMAGRVPGADDLDQFWKNLLAGHQSMEIIPDEQLEYSVHAELRHDPDYVPVRCSMKDYDLFDAEFFGFAPREAGIMDPQHRMVLEYAWRAFENAGYTAGDTAGIRTGVFASSDMSSYLLTNIYKHMMSGAIEVTEAVTSNDKDYLATRVAYKNNFTGPAMTVQAACSSSLASLHVACQALLAQECDRALVASATVLLPDAGYLYIPGGMRSPDGLCRPYDAEAGGAVFSNGVLAVLLKRLPDAIKDNDHIWAVIRATAANNDGNDKVGFAAPSVNGQAGAIRAALRISGVAPQDVAYVEGHGTATLIGDPIEVAALRKGYCPDDSSEAPGQTKSPIILSSLKGNIGHLDATAGLGSFVKVCLSLHHGVVPGTANFNRINPEMGDIAPFAVSAANVPLKREADIPLLAGVSAFGFGGTNVHAILQEAPEPAPRVIQEEPQLLLLSAHHEEALTMTCGTLAEHFTPRPEVSLSSTPLLDAAYTMAVGRKHFPVRGFVVAADRQQAAGQLRGSGIPRRVIRETNLSVAFLFPGQGNLHLGMAKSFYKADMLFRKNLHIVAEHITSAHGPDIVDVLQKCWSKDAAAASLLFSTQTAQPLLFGLEQAFAATLMEKGVTPACMVGHSLGEYAAACISGVFTLEEAATIIVERGKLMQSAPKGKMLVVSLNAARVGDVLGDLFSKVEISVINSPATRKGRK